MVSTRLVHVGIALAMTASAGCTHVTYRVIPSGTRLAAPAKPPDCQLTFIRTKIDQPYDEIAAVQVEAVRDGFFYPAAEEVQKRLGTKACELGADAVVVTQDYTTRDEAAVMTGVAIRYRVPLPPVEAK